LGTKLIRSLAYHPLTDGHTERVNQILEDMLRACAIIYSKNWDKYLSLAEFAHNNSYQSSLNMAPFEALYGRRCRTPLNWSQPEEREIFGPDLVTEAERKVKLIRKNLEAAQARQKSYHDKRRKPLQFEVGDFVYLKVSPTKGEQRFGIKGKLAPRYIGPYEIIEACGPVAYKLKLPSKMSAIHNVFHVSQLKKCVRLPTEVIAELEVEIELDLPYQEYPSKVLDCKERSTRAKSIKMYKIQWSNHSKTRFPKNLNKQTHTTRSSHKLLFTPGGFRPESRDEIRLRGEAITPQCYLGFFLVLTSRPLSHVNPIEQKTPKFRSKELVKSFSAQES
jgi:hypothetical protein